MLDCSRVATVAAQPAAQVAKAGKPLDVTTAGSAAPLTSFCCSVL